MVVKGSPTRADTSNMAPAGDMTFGDVRSSIIETGRLLARSGLVVGTAGNVSVRSGEHVAVTPTGARLGSLRADDIAIVYLDGLLVDGPLAPTSELPLHVAVYRRYEAGAVVHTHPPMGTVSPASSTSCPASTTPC